MKVWCYSPLKHEKPLKIKDFCVRVQICCTNMSNQDGKTIAEKALFYKGFRHFCCFKFRFALLVFEPLTPMYYIKIFRNIKIVCGYTKKSPPI